MVHGLSRPWWLLGRKRCKCGAGWPCPCWVDGLIRDVEVEKAQIERDRLRLVAEDRQRRAERLRHRVVQALDGVVR